MPADRGRFNREDFLAAQPERPEPPQSRGSFVIIMLAGGLGLMFLAVLIFLAAPLAPVVMAAVGFVFFFAALAAFHYVIWGWWLGDAIREEVAAEEEAERERLKAKD
jgi:hypothetical protein